MLRKLAQAAATVAACAAAAACAAVFLVSCSPAGQDLSYTNPSWRTSVNTAVSFPLAQQVTLRVGLGIGMSPPAPADAAVAWLEERTNIKLEFVSMYGGSGDAAAGPPVAVQLGLVGDVVLGELIRSGNLPDIVPESAIDLRDQGLRRLFVDVLEFPGLTPSFRKVVAANPRFRDGLLARLSEGDTLYSMGTWDPDQIPFAGVLAYRQDIFEARGLETDTWESIRRSLKALASLYPGSHPFGGSFTTIMSMMPSWFGSGYDRGMVAYFDNDSGAWKFGPYENGFREMVRYLADLYQQGIMSPDMMTEDGSTEEDYAAMFMAPWDGPTGPYITFLESYGELTPQGTWNGKGAWVSSLPLPPPPLGGTARESTRRFSAAGDGWLVYNQSPHVGEAVALLDLLFTEDASRILALGPEGTVWRQSRSTAELLGSYKDAYRDGGVESLSGKMREDGVATDLPLKGMLFGFVGAFGQPRDAALRYFLLRDSAVNRLGVDLYAETGLRIPLYDTEFRRQRRGVVVDLQTLIDSGVARLIMGQRDLAEYDAFKEELRRAGADKLLALYREHCTLGDPRVLDGEVTASP